MSFLYPDRIDIWRPGPQTGDEGGRQSYGGEDTDNLEPVLMGVRANVQAKGNGGSNPNGLPTDVRMAQWKIYSPRGAIAPGEVKLHDLIFDQHGRRFGVTSDYVPGLGGNIICDRLET